MKQKERNLPEVDVGGIPFYADALRGMLIDKENKDNTLSTTDMLRLEDHYEFVFDKQTRSLKPHNWGDVLNERYAYVWLRHLEVYDIEGASIRLGHEGSLMPENLPAIDMDGTEFLWDRQRTRLLQKDNPYNQIHKCSFDVRGGEMGIYFDRNRKVVVFPHEMEKLQQNDRLSTDIRFIPAAEINKKIKLSEAKQKRSFPKRKGMRV